MASQISFELASPQKMAVNKPVIMASVPGIEGRFCVLAGHAPLAAKLEAGVVEIYDSEGIAAPSERYFITGGYCEVISGRCSVLAEAVFRIDQLVAQKVEEEIKDLLVKANAAETEAERDALADQLTVARAKLFAAAA